MPDDPAIRLDHVSKVYRLYGSQRQQLFDVLGLSRFSSRNAQPVREFSALSDVSLVVPRGHRVGIVGRNGAGKTTLLKLICGNFAPTSGEVTVNGAVQALLGIGLGFHPDYTGRENVHASLQYNGLSRSEYASAMEEIIDFCELGQYIDQPFKTYSLGMQARLMFASATAIRPEILIVDEVLGAGDAYFVAKSKQRVEKLVSSGCTMLLVSHSMGQVLELCKEAVWLDHGRIRMQGDAFRVVKAYEEHLHGPGGAVGAVADPRLHLEKAIKVSKSATVRPRPLHNSSREVLLQEPEFIPNSMKPVLTPVPDSESRVMHHQAPGGVSRWESETGLKVTGFAISSANGIGNRLAALQPARFTLFLTAELDGEYDCRYGIAVHDLMGQCVARILSPPDRFQIEAGEPRRVELTLNPIQLGPGEYTVGISILENGPLEQLNSVRRFDLLGRSFSFSVALPDSLAPVAASFFHTGEWTFSETGNE